MRLFALALAMVHAAAQAPPLPAPTVQFARLVPKGSALFASVVLSNRSALLSGTTVSAQVYSGSALLLNASGAPQSVDLSGEAVFSVGSFPATPQVTVVASVARGPAQTFSIDASEARELVALFWRDEGNGNFTLEPIPANWSTSAATWSAACEGRPVTWPQPWTARSVAAAATEACLVVVTMDAAGYVDSDVLVVGKGGVLSGATKMRPSMLAVILLFVQLL